MQKPLTLFFLSILLFSCKTDINNVAKKLENKSLEEQHSDGFNHAEEPNEKAFTFLVPENWSISGGITRVSSNLSDAKDDRHEAKLYLKLTSPDAKSTLCWLPNNNYFAPGKSRKTKNQPSEKNTSNFPEMSLLSPADFGIQIAFPFAHPHASELRIIENKKLEEVAKEYQLLSTLSSPKKNCDFMAASVTIQYLENGTTFRERIICVIESSNDSGNWGNRDTWYIRSKTDQFVEMLPTFSTICKSVRVNPIWIEKEILLQQKEIRADISNKDLSTIEKEIYEQRIRVNTAIATNLF